MLKQLRKESGFTIIELLIVIAIIGILATLVLTNFQGAQAKGRDTVRKNDINSIYQKLEEYYNENGSYPDDPLTAAVFPGIDAGALDDASGNTIEATFTTANAPSMTTLTKSTPGGTSEYLYAAYGDGTGGCTQGNGAGCLKYRLATYLEKEAQYEKNSLN
jgi:prepilin-type N-terminal cleavage/methylation domain-containing protein